MTPESNHLLKVNINLDKLSGADVQTFHTLVEKLLFLSKRAQPEILTSVFFLTTIVREPGVYDKKSLSLVLKCLQGSWDLALTLESDGSGSMKWWDDTAFAVHQDMIIQTGGIMSLGKGAI